MVETMELIADPPRLRRRTAARPDASARAARMAVTGLFLMNGLLFATWVSRLPVVQAVHGLSNGQLGFALLAIATGAVVAMPTTGWLLGRFGSRAVTGLCALLYAAALPWLAFAPDTSLLVGAMLLFGTVHGGCDVAMNAQAIEIEKRYGRSIMSSFHAFFSLGGLLGAVLGGFVAYRQVPITVHFVIVAALALVVMTFWTLPNLLRTQRADVPAADVTSSRRKGFAWPSLVLVSLGAVAICVMMGEGAMADWTAIYLRRVLGSTEGWAAIGYAAFSIAMAVGRLSGDHVADAIGPVGVVRGGGILAAVGLGLALLGSQAWLALAGFACVGVGFSAVVPLVFSAAGRLPRTDPHVALSTVTTLGYLGFLVGPPLIGVVAEFAGLRTGMALIAGSSLLVALLAGSLRRRD